MYLFPLPLEAGNRVFVSDSTDRGGVSCHGTYEMQKVNMESGNTPVGTTLWNGNLN